MFVDLGHYPVTHELLLTDLGHSMNLDLYIVKQCHCPSVPPDAVKEVHCLSVSLYFWESYPPSLILYISAVLDVVNVGDFP
jgi:hypothetical protein